MGGHVGAIVTQIRGVERAFEDREGTARQVDGNNRIGFVHRQDKAVTLDALALAQCLFQGLTQSNGAVFDGVVRIGVQIALAFET